MRFYDRAESRELNDLARNETGGSFIQLPEGWTHYELSNPETPETVVLVHGFSTPSFIYDPTFLFLTRSGFRVLRYDLFGRGFSDRPRARYTIDFFVRQLRDLLEALHFSRPVSLVGLSMGGPLTAAFTRRFPEQVKKLILIDPAGTKPAFPPSLVKLVTLPVLAEAILHLIGNGATLERLASDVFDRTHVERFRERYLVQMQFKGFRQAILSTVRNGMLGSFLDDYRQTGKMDKPVLLFWGRQDRTVPFAHSRILTQAMPRAELHVIENCGHLPHYEKPEEVNPILLKFLKE